MQTAYSGSTTFTASNFARLSEEERASFRGKLECEGCGADAHFRKKSIIGQKAHFAAHHHDHCTLAVEGNSPSTAEKSSGKLPGKKLGARIIIRTGIIFPQKDKAQSTPFREAEVRYENSGTSKAGVGGTTPWLGMNAILTMLIEDPTFSQSSLIVQFGDFPELPASEFFVSLTDKKLDHMRGERRGFWGRIFSTAPGAAGLWLNNGGDDGPNIWIPNELKAEAEERFGFSSTLSKQGTMVLALGELNRSPITKYIKINDLNFLAVARVDR